MRKILTVLRGAALLFAAASINGCGSAPAKPVPPAPTVVTAPTIMPVDRLRYTPLPEAVSAENRLPPYPPRALVGDDLLDRISQLEHIVLVDEAQKAAAACLGDNLVGSDSAQKCLDALAAIVNPVTR